MEEPPGECGCVGGDVSHAIHFYESEGDDEYVDVGGVSGVSHGIHFYAVRDDDNYSFSFHVGGASAGREDKRSGDGLSQGGRLCIIRDLCRDPDVKYLRVSWFAHYDFAFPLC